MRPKVGGGPLQRAQNNNNGETMLPETSKQAYENKLETSDFYVCGKKKKKKKQREREREYYTLHTHKYHPESRNIIIFILFFYVVWSFLY